MDDFHYTPPLAERLPLKLTVEQDTTTVASLAARPWVDEELRASLHRANIVFVQWESFRDIDRPVFPTHTAELFHYFQENTPPDIQSEVAVRDEDFSEVSLHADLVWLPDILIPVGTLVVLPVVVNLISEWLKQRLLDRHARTDAKLQVIIESPDGGSKRLIYEGPADELWRITNLAQQVASADATALAPVPSVPKSLEKPADTASDKQ
ncbi:hypothetical protein [Hymenobacter profundi]|uniref:Uncharacterized protein n=1 Tax=Hymenobacter profundi TaxID=1982110 RepID=A0ABS6WWR3_9BACT|nr:hypothetical protein [Hymenobacter profundi]MBW3127199.1 hypothetical protein [Hymenobacter profundi]